MNVTIVITPKGYTTTLNLGGDPIVSEWITTRYGGKALDKGFEDHPDIPESLYEMLDENDLLGIANELNEMNSGSHDEDGDEDDDIEIDLG